MDIETSSHCQRLPCTFGWPSNKTGHITWTPFYLKCGVYSNVQSNAHSWEMECGRWTKNAGRDSWLLLFLHTHTHTQTQLIYSTYICMYHVQWNLGKRKLRNKPRQTHSKRKQAIDHMTVTWFPPRAHPSTSLFPGFSHHPWQGP